MATFSFTFDQSSLERLRPLSLVVGKRRRAIPKKTIYAPLHKFIEERKTAEGSQYQFRMIDLLHAAAVKMMGGKVSESDDAAIFAVGGLAIALDQQHPSLAIDKTFGDFRAGFSHQFGIALSVMIISEAFGVAWDRLSPIPVKSSKTLDYEIQLPNGGWLKMEAKGTSSGNRDNAHSGIRGKMRAERKDPSSSDMAMLGVIVSTAQSRTDHGVIEIVDPPFEPDQNARRYNVQLAGRYRHYAAAVHFAGLASVSEHFIQIADHLEKHGQMLTNSPYKSLLPKATLRLSNGHELVGFQWQLGDGIGDNNIWLYQGFDLRRLKTILAGGMPDLTCHHFGSTHREEVIDSQAGELLQLPYGRAQTPVAESLLPDGSYFGIGSEPLDGLARIDRRDQWDESRIGQLSR